jgi:hypothetical protein
LVGTESGWGYGIHIDNPTKLNVERNFIKRSTRHGIYCGRATVGSDIRIDGNFIFAHDQEDANPITVAAAPACAQSSDVRIAFNTILDSRLYALSVEPDDVFGWPTEDIFLVGNQILGARRGGIWVYTGGDHVALGNTVTQKPDCGWEDYLIELQYGSRLVCPDERWADDDDRQRIAAVFRQHSSDPRRLRRPRSPERRTRQLLVHRRTRNRRRRNALQLRRMRGRGHGHVNLYPYKRSHGEPAGNLDDDSVSPTEMDYSHSIVAGGLDETS